MMKWQNNQPDSSDSGHWQTISDIMSALVLMLLLVILLLVLYVVRVPENDNIDPYLGTDLIQRTDDEMGDNDDDDEERAHDWFRDNDDGSDHDNGGGGGGGNDETVPVETTEPTDQTHDLPGDFDGIEKAAVYVTVLDAETLRTIKEPDIAFNLKDARGEVEFLNDYYPYRITYQEFRTTENGTFFLPEKIWLGEHTLHQISEPYGYDASEDILMYLAEARDWDDPHHVEVLLYPARNTIRISSVDADTNEPVSGGIFDVVAREDIITADGTLRYRAGQRVDRIVCGEDGEGESIPLFLGEYTVSQSEPARYYASVQGTANVSVEKRMEGSHGMDYVALCHRTTYTVTLADELYHNIRLAGTFTVSYDNGGTVHTLMTDEDGVIHLDHLEKNTTYRIHQTVSSEGYTRSTDWITFNVTADGRIDGEIEAQSLVTNRTLRLSVAVKDIILQGMVSNYNVALYDAADELVARWDSTAMAHNLEGLSTGTYKLVVAGGGGNTVMLEVVDIAEIQTVESRVWTNSSIAALAGIVIAVLGTTAILTAVLRRRRAEKGQ